MFSIHHCGGKWISHVVSISKRVNTLTESLDGCNFNDSLVNITISCDIDAEKCWFLNLFTEQPHRELFSACPGRSLLWKRVLTRKELKCPHDHLSSLYSSSQFTEALCPFACMASASVYTDSPLSSSSRQPCLSVMIKLGHGRVLGQPLISTSSLDGLGWDEKRHLQGTIHSISITPQIGFLSPTLVIIISQKTA